MNYSVYKGRVNAVCLSRQFSLSTTHRVVTTGSSDVLGKDATTWFIRKPRLLLPPRRQLLPNGQRKPKGKPRGISAMRAKDPSIPNPLEPFKFKPGVANNPGGRSKKTRLSEAVADELSRVHDPNTGVTRAGILASNLLDRAEKDSSELERVLRITEPQLSQNLSAVGLSVETDDVSVVFKKLNLD